jgi:hypothetical protein
MAVTFTPAKVTGANTTFGNKRRRVVDITCSGTYTPGGDTFDTYALFGLRSVDEVLIHNGLATDGTVAYPALYVAATGKLKFFEGPATGAGLAEKGSGESLASVTFRATAYGTK